MSKVPDRARPTITSRLGLSVPSAIGALLFAGAIVLGSGMVDRAAPQSGTADGETAATDNGTKPGSGWHDGKPGHDYTEDKQQPDHSQPDKTPKPEPAPKEQPAPEQAKPPQTQPPAPPATVVGLQLAQQTFESKVKLTWSAFQGAGFAYYKLVRSSDADVSWPAGAGDSLVAAVGDPYATFFKDFPPCNTNWFYRVFAVMASESGYATLAASNTVSAYVACVVKPPPPPPPPPSSMAFSAEVINGQVHLTWEKCTAAGFGAYKVVRSQSNPDPLYPLNGGSELIAAIGDPNVTSLVDANVASGQTWFYRVLSMGNNGSGWYPLGITPVLTVTIP